MAQRMIHIKILGVKGFRYMKVGSIVAKPLQQEHGK